jgi:hypothetical protein
MSALAIFPDMATARSSLISGPTALCMTSFFICERLFVMFSGSHERLVEHLFESMSCWMLPCGLSSSVRVCRYEELTTR